MTKTLVLLALLPCGQAAMSMELVDDLRVELGGFGTAGTSDHLNVSAGPDSAIYHSGSLDQSSNSSYDQVTYAIKFVYGELSHDGGLLMSIGFAGWSSSHDYNDPGTFFGTTTLNREIEEFQFGIGYGLPTNRWSYLEMMADLGLGYMDADGYDRSTSFGYSEVENASGGEASAGAHVGWFARLPHSRFVLGAQVGGSEHVAHLHNDFSTGTSYDESFHQTIIDVRIGFGYRFW